MIYEKEDSLILMSIHSDTCVYAILMSVFNVTKKLITYEDLDMGLNRLITNKLIKKVKNAYSITEKGNSLIQTYKEQIKKEENEELYLDILKDLEMDRIPNLLRRFLTYKEYINSLTRLASELGEENLNIKVLFPSETKIKAANPLKSKTKIIQMLADAKITIENFNLADVFPVLREFMDIKYDSEDDDLLFQTGVFFNKDVFTFDFTRQFSINDRYGNYSHLAQLGISLEFENNSELNTLSTTIWSTDYQSLDDFFNAVKEEEAYLKISDTGILKNISVIYERV